MSDKIDKIHEKVDQIENLNKEAVDLFKEDKQDEAIAKMEEIQKIHDEINDLRKDEEVDDDPEDTPDTSDEDDGGDTPDDKEPVKKDEETVTVKLTKAEHENLQTLLKWARVEVSASDVKTMLDEFWELKTQLTKVEGIEGLNDRIKKVESARGISKQDKEPIDKDEDDVWKGLF